MTKKSKSKQDDIKQDSQSFEQKVKWLETLYHVTHEVVGSLSLEKCLKTIVHETKKILKIKRVSLLLIDQEKKHLRIKVAAGIDPSVIRKTIVKMGEGISGWVAFHKKPIFVDDITQKNHFSSSGFSGYDTKSFISVPLMFQEECIGVLNVNNKISGEPFYEDDFLLLKAFANEASMAIKNARLYTELKEANQRLKEMDALKSNFVACVSHELRTPIASMRYLIAAVLDDKKSAMPEEQREYCMLVEENLERLTRLVNDILDMSKIEAKKLTLDRRLLLMSDIVKNIKISFEGLAEKKGITLKTHMQKRNIYAYADQDKISQILYNLLNNALKFTPNKGRVDIKLRYETRVNQTMIRVSVSDTGPGIPDDEKKRVFDQFYQCHKGTSGTSGGTGLGLTITKELIELHEGILGVKENPFGPGAVFEFVIPACDSTKYLKEFLPHEVRHAPPAGFAISMIILRFQFPKNAGLKVKDKILQDTQNILGKYAEARDMVFEEDNKLLGIYYGINPEKAKKNKIKIENNVQALLMDCQKNGSIKFQIKRYSYTKNISAFKTFITQVSEEWQS